MNRLRKALSLTAVLSMLAMPTVALTSAASAATPPPQVQVSANQPWTDTGVDVSGSVMLTASGTINVGGPEGNLPPAGSKSCVASASQYSGQWVALGFPCWSLIARVGNNPAFKVGNGGTFKVPSGRLLLGVDDELAAFGDNSGSWTVKVESTQSNVPSEGAIALEQLIQRLSSEEATVNAFFCAGGAAQKALKDKDYTIAWNIVHGTKSGVAILEDKTHNKWAVAIYEFIPFKSCYELAGQAFPFDKGAFREIALNAIDTQLTLMVAIIDYQIKHPLEAWNQWARQAKVNFCDGTYPILSGWCASK